MTDLAIRWLVSLVLTLAVAAGSYWAGDHNRNNAWLAKQATVASDALTEYQREVRRGGDAAADLSSQLRAQQTQYSTLEGKFHELRKRTPLVVATPDLACAGLGIAPLSEAHMGAQTSGDGPVLSNAAVWMWNTSLAGANLPAGACGTADPTDPACAAASGLTVGDAWENHTTNAKSCAEDRLRHQHLIDFLKGRTP